MPLTDAQQRELLNDGYTLLRGAVPPDVVARAMRAINHSLGSKGLPPDQLRNYGSLSFCPELRSDETIVDLFEASQLAPACHHLFGEDNLRPVGSGQIALRFPSMGEPRPPGAHIDGVPSPGNGVTPGTLSSFTALAGVFLSDVSGPDSGNFSVWPGSHRKHEAYFREHGTDDFLQGKGGPRVDLGEPHQIIAQAGDAVLCHYLLGHGVASNVSPNVRYAAFFRIQTRTHDEHKRELLCDLWQEWSGLRP